MKFPPTNIALMAFPKQVAKLRPAKAPARRYVRSMTPARAKEYRQYLKRAAEFLARNSICMLFGYAATEVHHRAGRGKFLLAENTWVPVSRKGHQYIHNNPAWSYKNKWLLHRQGPEAMALLDQWNQIKPKL